METRGGARRAWALGLLTGGLFAAGLALFGVTVVWPDGPWWGSVLTGLCAGTVFGAVLGPAITRTEREMWRACAEDLTWPEFRASRSGRVPPDSRLYAAATRLAVYQLAQHRRRRRSTVIACAPAAGFSALNAVLGNVVGLFGAGGIVIVAGVFLHERVRLSKALLRLREDSPA
ncbi:hypothetical protein MUY14_30210 [Amycolatopsis sp. FBCC-B4732]|uniref:hypothetical protein n=1 Tax=Amycolatopsis sp. FBCC-B4732 TaxID=3079339 RepID=UPI001FF4C25C|nr:hypothetical protein [Amycolatopsis sp. FBCC-B4732]UOX86030.1 hypothetical protein MUY14_30210 [Amycolatopsis sp. FBCC-B4732]